MGLLRSNNNSTTTSVSNRIVGFIEFGRPHTLLGTIIAITSLFFIHSQQSPYTTLQDGMLYLLISIALASNYYIVGLNQLVDIDIDQINKPYLPLPSSLLSLTQAKVITAMSGLFALVVSWLTDTILGLMITISLLIGTMYSVRPFRLKNRGLWGSFAIIIVRVFVINLGFSYHIVSYFNLPLFQVLNHDIVYLLFMVGVISISISLFKDIPDMKGDKQFNIGTVVIMYGKQPIFLISRILIYTILLVGAVYSLTIWQSVIIAIIHVIFLTIMVVQIEQTDISSDTEVMSTYKYFWYLYYLIYLLPLI